MKPSEKNIEKLKTYIGKVYQRRVSEEKFLFQSYQVKDEKVTIATDNGWLETNIYDLPVFLKDFQLVHIPTFEIIPVEKKQEIVIPMKTVDNNIMHKLLDTLMDNIDKVKADRSYIDQARTINSSVQGVINIAKLEIDMRTKL